MDGMGGERLGEAELRKGAEGGGTGANFSEAALHTIRSAYALHTLHATCRAHAARHAPRTCRASRPVLHLQGLVWGGVKREVRGVRWVVGVAVGKT